PPRPVRPPVGDDARLVDVRRGPGRVDGRVQVADLVDQARLEGLRGVEDAAVGQLGEAAQVEAGAALAHDAHEARVEVVQDRLDDASLPRRRAAGRRAAGPGLARLDVR